jgi:hypothetical protein
MRNNGKHWIWLPCIMNVLLGNNFEMLIENPQAKG